MCIQSHLVCTTRGWLVVLSLLSTALAVPYTLLSTSQHLHGILHLTVYRTARTLHLTVYRTARTRYPTPCCVPQNTYTAPCCVTHLNGVLYPLGTGPLWTHIKGPGSTLVARTTASVHMVCLVFPHRVYLVFPRAYGAYGLLGPLCIWSAWPTLVARTTASVHMVCLVFPRAYGLLSLPSLHV